MSSLAVDGLISGLNTTDLINNLMALEAAPQRLLKSKSSAASGLVSALQALNTKVASLASAAKSTSDAKSWDLHKVSSSSTVVTATANAGAVPSSLTFAVDRLANGQVSLVSAADTAALAVEPAPAITVVRGGRMVTITPAKGSYADITAAINAAKDAGLSAVAVPVGTDGSFRLQLSGVSGAGNAFDVYIGDEAAVKAGTAKHIVNSADDPAAAGTTTITKAQDAQLTLWKGTGAEATFTSTSNTFTDVLPGVSFTLNEKPADPVTLTVKDDTDAVTNMVAGLINNATVVLSEITSRTASTTKMGADGREIIAGGILSGNSAVRTLSGSVRSAISAPVNGRSPSEVGIDIDRTGALKFNKEKFATALADDPEATQAMVTALAKRVADAAKAASDPIEGALSLQITSQEDVVKDLNKRIEDWDRRLEVRRTGLERTYSALEVALSKLQSQSSWLAGQLASLPRMSSD
ncbi:flagellar filament capping protein FliD [Georgenia yuyongxinii]|uniref:Flagellar hook-associated protein 2 n=1 Tax=Georgenia yuyongxinii TaxID=2589797 RepID=A0A552WS10_9MICO|nr:flagellar filament capping protein FliD [Georgenia yuyongxinii]TRW45618.1 flagellar cap protein [Georgenia yuyongxinii]